MQIMIVSHPRRNNFQNAYAMIGIGEKGEVLFGVNFPRLVELKKRYDPRNIFGKNLNLL
jgi:hypothetical protein